MGKKGKKKGLGPRGSSTSGKSKGISPSPLIKAMCRNGRSYKHPYYETWCRLVDEGRLRSSAGLG